MRLVLKDFQATYVDELVDNLRWAAREVKQNQKAQAVGLSSPTGSGKTVMVAAAMEQLMEGDAENLPLADATFLWITDQPQLNEQTRRKLVKDSSLFSESNMLTIGSAFDRETFAPGTLYFINVQKLGKERDLITKGDERQFTIWDTITNTIEAMADRFFVVIDEAHRGMSEGSQGRADANTIIQKFIKGSPDEIPKVPLVLGISATLDRFNRLISGTSRTTRSVEVSIDQVRDSGLLKEVVTLYHPTEKQPTDMTMLREAVRSWREFRKQWENYCKEQGEQLVRPVLVVQVQDGTAQRTSKTDLDDVVVAIEDEVGSLPTSALAHAFQEGSPITMNGKQVRYLAPADIDGDEDVEIVLFKTSLNTGWDCPRAEVIMSFRTALDATSIAQLVGRMVRTPLARRIESSDFLNNVGLYLPHYDAAGLNKVVNRLTSPDPDFMPPVDFRSGENLVTVSRVEGFDELFEQIGRLPSYIVPTQGKTSQVRRLMKLARALANDEIIPDAEDVGFALLLGVLKEAYKRSKDSTTFAKLVEDRSEIEVRAVDWQVGLESVSEDTVIKLKVSPENIDDVFEEAGRRIGDEGLHKQWWKLRRSEKVDNSRAKLELVALSVDSAVRRALETTARDQVQRWLRAYDEEIADLPERRTAVYDDIRAKAADPELRGPVTLPLDLTVTATDSTWKRHLYHDGQGNFPAALNKWESKVVGAEAEADTDCKWLRNIPRKAWALTVPYEVNGKPAAYYPDFLFFRKKKGGKWVCDLLDPHLIDLADAPAKAVGLAKYAAKHSVAFGRIELIIIKGDDICRINLTDEATRDKVLAVHTKEHLAHLFEELGAIS